MLLLLSMKLILLGMVGSTPSGHQLLLLLKMRLYNIFLLCHGNHVGQFPCVRLHSQFTLRHCEAQSLYVSLLVHVVHVDGVRLCL
jgi:hypothetical protein